MASLAANISLFLNTEPDPISALALGIWYFFLAIIGLPGNLLIIFLWLTNAELRNVPANTFIFNGAIADAAYLLSSGIINLHWSLYHQLDVCKVGGFLTYFLALYGYSIPPYLAINRDFVIRRVHRNPNSWKEKLFSLNGTKIMSIAMWLYILSVNLPFVYFNMYGRDAIGICGIVFDLPVGLFVQFYICMLGTFFISQVLTIVYYRKLNQWIVRMTHGVMSKETKGVIRETEKLMKLTKWLALMPVFCSSPSASLNFFDRFFPELVNVRIARIIMIPFNFTCLTNPVVTIIFMKPFRNALFARIRKIHPTFGFDFQTANIVENPSNRSRISPQNQPHAIRIATIAGNAI